jgi:ABC-type nitrate/sulfonate/bicarbonate transport system permease component
MKLRTVFLSLVTLTIGIATGAMIAQVRPVEERVNEVARAAHPIPLIAVSESLEISRSLEC